MYDNFSPKYREKAMRIFQKLEGQASIKDDQVSRMFDERYLQVSDKLRAFRSKNQRTLTWLQQQLEKYSHQLQILEKNKQSSASLEKELYDNLQQQIESQYVQYSQSLHCIKKEMISKIEHRYKTMKNEAIEEISLDFDNLCKQHYQQINRRIDKLTEILEQQKNRKEDAAQYLIYTFGDQILNLQQAVAQQQQNRIRSNRLLIDRIDEIQQKIEMELSEETNKREKQGLQTQKKLEDVCYQIQVKAFGKN